jgi:hypothetical protein
VINGNRVEDAYIYRLRAPVSATKGKTEMEPERFQHRRTHGGAANVRRCYLARPYTVALNGSILKQWQRPVIAGNVSDPMEVARVFAISDIEGLVGMAEE